MQRRLAPPQIRIIKSRQVVMDKTDAMDQLHRHRIADRGRVIATGHGDRQQDRRPDPRPARKHRIGQHRSQFGGADGLCKYKFTLFCPKVLTQNEETLPEPEKAVVIGAGMGGLAAATRLAAKGYAVTVVAMADGPGGKDRAVPTAVGPVDTGPTVLT